MRHCPRVYSPGLVHKCSQHARNSLSTRNSFSSEVNPLSFVQLVEAPLLRVHVQKCPIGGLNHAQNRSHIWQQRFRTLTACGPFSSGLWLNTFFFYYKMLQNLLIYNLCNPAIRSPADFHVSSSMIMPFFKIFLYLFIYYYYYYYILTLIHRLIVSLQQLT